MAKKSAKQPKPTDQNAPAGYPTHPKQEDIYKAFKEDQSIDPDDLTHEKEEDPDADNTIRGAEPTDTEIMGTDLDIPGAELDDEQEGVGSEDEENNYYSLGGEKELEEEHPEDV
jgi:hypothetical protein